MRRPSARLASSLLLAGLLAGCGERTYTATFTIGDGDLTAGEASGYSIAVVDDRGEEHTGEARLERIDVDPPEGVTRDAATLTFTVATRHQAIAVLSIDGQEVRAETSVDVQPGPAALVQLELTNPTPAAGESVSYTARLTDRFDNPSQPPGSFKLEVNPRDDVTLNASAGTVMCTQAVPHTLTATDLGSGLEGQATIDVRPAEAQSVRLSLSETRTFPGDTVEAVLLGKDGFGNEFALEASFAVTPTDGVQIKSDGIRFTQEGSFSVEGSSGDLRGRGTVVVDGTPPALLVTSPNRAAFITEDLVTVTGSIEDPVAGLAFLKVNGAEATIRGNAFSLELVPQPGTNVLTFEAEDLNGNPTTWVQSYLHAPEWTPLAAPSRGGLYGRLNQGTLDIATDLLLAELDAEELEQDLMAENPIYTYKSDALTTEVNVTSFHFDEPVGGALIPHADQNSGYLEIVATFRNLSAELEAHGKLLWDEYDMQGRVSAGTGIARGQAFATIKDGVATVTLKNVDVQLEDLDLWFSGNFLDSIADIAQDDIEEELETSLEELILTELPPLLAETLNYLNYSTSLEVPIGENTGTIGIVTQLESLTFDDTGITLGETTVLDAVTDPRMPANPGAPKVGAADLSYPAVPGYFLSASMDALNTVLHALWSTGVLTYGYSVQTDTGQSLTAEVDLPLPPVIQPSQVEGYLIDASAGDIILDLYTDTTNTSSAYQLAVSLFVPATVEIGTDGLTISVLFGEPVMAYQLLKAPARGLDASTLGNLVEELVDELLTLAQESTTDIALPEFEGYQLTIAEVDLRGSSWGYLTVGGDLQ